MCFTSLVGREGPLPAVPQRLSQCGKERTEKEKETRAAAPPYESHLRPPRPPLPRLARYYSGHVLFSFIFHGAEYARDSGEGGRREEGRKEASMARLLSCCTALQHRCPLDHGQTGIRFAPRTCKKYV